MFEMFFENLSQGNQVYKTNGSVSSLLVQKIICEDIITDSLVVGGGIAGLTTALKIASFSKVVLISKGPLQQANSYYAQGGIASVMSTDDSFEKHISDTHTAGDGICKDEVVRAVVEAGPKAIEELIELGVEFTKKKKKQTLKISTT